MSSNNTNTLSDFYNPVYLQGFEYINYFAEFQNNENNWIKLVYFIDRSRFKSSLGTNKALRNHVAYNGEPVFSIADKIDFNKFKLKEETVEASDIPNVYKVTEVYGYSPAFTYVYYDSQLVDTIGYTDTSKMRSSSVGSATYISEDNTLRIHCSNTTFVDENLHVGDIVNFTRLTSTWNNGTSWRTIYGGSSSSTKITKITTQSSEYNGTTTYYRYIFVDANFTFNIIPPNGGEIFSYSGAGIAEVFNESIYYNGLRVLVAACQINKSADITPSLTKKQTTLIKVSFYEEPPEELEQKFYPKNYNGTEAETITDFTIPTTTLWKKIINGTATEEEIASLDGITNNGYMLVEDATITNFHGIYKKELIYTKIK